MHGIHPAHLQFLDLRVRREHLLEDAVAQLRGRSPSDLKKPLRVTFASGGVPEEGLDQGGVTKACISTCFTLSESDLPIQFVSEIMVVLCSKPKMTHWVQNLNFGFRIAQEVHNCAQCAHSQSRACFAAFEVFRAYITCRIEGIVE